MDRNGQLERGHPLFGVAARHIRAQGRNVVRVGRELDIGGGDDPSRGQALVGDLVPRNLPPTVGYVTRMGYADTERERVSLPGGERNRRFVLPFVDPDINDLRLVVTGIALVAVWRARRDLGRPSGALAARLE